MPLLSCQFFYTLLTHVYKHDPFFSLLVIPSHSFLPANLKNHTTMSFRNDKLELAKAFIAERSITNLGLTGEISEERRIITFSIDDIRKPGAIEALDDLLKLSQYRTHINMGDGAQQSAAGEQIATLLLVLRVGTIGWQGEQRAR